MGRKQGLQKRILKSKLLKQPVLTRFKELNELVSFFLDLPCDVRLYQKMSAYLHICGDDRIFSVRFSDHAIPWRHDETGYIINHMGVHSHVHVDYYFDKGITLDDLKKNAMQYVFGVSVGAGQ